MYLRMALWAMIPTLERMHWEQVAKDFESLAIKDAFEEITLGLMEDAINADRYCEERPGSAHSVAAGVCALSKRNRVQFEVPHWAAMNAHSPQFLPLLPTTSEHLSTIGKKHLP